MNVGLSMKRERTRSRMRSNKNFGIQCFLTVLAAGYLLFFTSDMWIPDNGKLKEATPYYTKTSCENYTFYLTQFAYSEKDRALQVILEVENKDVKDKKLEYSAVEKKEGNLKVEVLQEEPNYAILKINDLGSYWKEISFRVQEKGQETQAKFYTNVDTVEKVASLPELTKAQYQIERLEKQIAYDEWQIAEKEDEINGLQKENKEIEKRIASLEEDTYPTDEEAQKARELVIRAQGKKRSNEDTISDREEETGQLTIRSDNIAQQIEELGKQEAKK